jgi:hypothetical protein
MGVPVLVAGSWRLGAFIPANPDGLGVTMELQSALASETLVIIIISIMTDKAREAILFAEHATHPLQSHSAISRIHIA